MHVHAFTTLKNKHIHVYWNIVSLTDGGGELEVRAYRR